MKKQTTATKQIINRNEPLLSYACATGIAHALTLYKNGTLTNEEFALVKQSFDEIAFLAKSHSFVSTSNQDIYEAIAGYLNERLGKIATKLSPFCCNQQALDLHLFIRDRILKVMEAIFSLVKTVLACTETLDSSSKNVSNELWCCAFLETFLDNLEFLKSTYSLINQFPTDFTTDNENEMFCKLLDLNYLPHSPYYQDIIQGKAPASVLFAYTQILNDLSKMSVTLISSNPKNKNTELLEIPPHNTSVKEDFLKVFNLCKETSPFSFLQPITESTEKTLFAIQACTSTLEKIQKQNKTKNLEDTQDASSLKPLKKSILKRFRNLQKWKSDLHPIED